MAFGISKSKSKSKSQSDSTSTTTPNVPSWISDPVQQLTGKLGSLIGSDPSQYAPTSNPTLDNAFGAAANLGNKAPGGLFDKFQGAVNGIGQFTGSAANGIKDFLNPYLDDVVGATMASSDNNDAKQQAQYAALGAKNKAFGGSRFGVGETNLQAEQGLNRANVEGKLRSDGFNSATQAALADQAQRAQAAIAQAGLFGQAGEQERANVESQANLGMNQAQFEALQKQFPLEFLQQLGGMFGGLGLENFIGQTQTGSQTGKSSGSQLGVSASYGG